VTNALVLLHAFPLDSRVWDEVVTELQSPRLLAGHPRLARWRIFAPDFRGFGAVPLGSGSAVPPPSLDVLAADVVALLDREGVERATVAGVSLGGYVAMAMLRIAPERLNGLILVDTKATADGDEARANRLRIAGEMDTGGDVRVLARAMLPSLLGATTHAKSPAIVDVVRGWIESADPAAIAWVQRAMAARPDSVADLRSFSGQATVIWGEEDALIGTAEQEILSAALGRGVSRIPAAGHLSPVEAPTAVANVLAGQISHS
jgi:pimeloyl-ACP methyl ester carboxylesterase